MVGVCPTLPNTFAHTHACEYDYCIKSSVCLEEENFLLNSDGTPSDILWHELGHVIDCEDFLFVGGCKNHYTKSHHLEEHFAVTRWGMGFPLERNTLPLGDEHGPSWQYVMAYVLEKPHLISVSGNIPY